MTTDRLHVLKKSGSATSEVFKFFGVFLLKIKFEFARKTVLWKTTKEFKFIPAPFLVETEMSKNSFLD